MTFTVNTLIGHAIEAAVVGIAAAMFAGPFALILFSPAIGGL